MIINNFEELPMAKTAYEEQIITFCRQWIAGQQTFVLHTSGSTGIPKPIVLTRQQMQASALLTGKTFGLNRGDSALVCLNVAFIAGVMMLVRGLVLGLKLTIVEPNSNPFKGLENPLFDFAAFVPLQLQTILTGDQSFDEPLNNMKAIIVGGAAVGMELSALIQPLKVPVFSTYGMTETVSHIAVRKLNGEDKSDFFRVLAEVKVWVDDRKCLAINAAATNFEDVQTNDLVEFINENEFRLIGRADNIINSGGVKIQLEKIEKTFDSFMQTYGIKRFFAAGIEDKKLGQKLILVLETDTLTEEIIQKIKHSDFHQLSKYEIPKEVFSISPFYETPTGKIDKKATIKKLNL